MNPVGVRMAVAWSVIGMIVASTPSGAAERATPALSFAVGFPTASSAKALDGRVILLLSRDLTREPRSHVEPNEPLASPYLFGLNVESLAPGAEALLNDSA